MLFVEIIASSQTSAADIRVVPITRPSGTLSPPGGARGNERQPHQRARRKRPRSWSSPVFLADNLSIQPDLIQRYLPDWPSLFAEWETSIVAHAFHGHLFYDGRLVAARQSHCILRPLTFNASNFVGIPRLGTRDMATFEGLVGPTRTTP